MFANSTIQKHSEAGEILRERVTAITWSRIFTGYVKNACGTVVLMQFSDVFLP